MAHIEVIDNSGGSFLNRLGTSRLFANGSER